MFMVNVYFFLVLYPSILVLNLQLAYNYLSWIKLFLFCSLTFFLLYKFLSCMLRKLFISFYLIYLLCWSSSFLLNPVPSGTVLSFMHNPVSLLNSSFVYFFVLLPTIYDIYWFVLKSSVFYMHKVHSIRFFNRVWILIKKNLVIRILYFYQTQ